MLRRFLAQHPTFGTKNNPRSLSYQQQSPYYWWWAYLRRNEDYLKCCEKSGKGKFAKLYKEKITLRNGGRRNSEAPIYFLNKRG
jgi:hypothetical protein